MKDGGIIKDGYNEEVDKLRSAQRQKERPGWQSWKPEEREKYRHQKPEVSNITRYLAIIWK